MENGGLLVVEVEVNHVSSLMVIRVVCVGKWSIGDIRPTRRVVVWGRIKHSIPVSPSRAAQ